MKCLRPQQDTKTTTRIERVHSMGFAHVKHNTWPFASSCLARYKQLPQEPGVVQEVNTHTNASIHTQIQTGGFFNVCSEFLARSNVQINRAIFSTFSLRFAFPFRHLAVLCYAFYCRLLKLCALTSIQTTAADGSGNAGKGKVNGNGSGNGMAKRVSCPPL